VIGETLSHFLITARLGAGGMGEVYRATDTRLGREVAIKVLPETLDDDAGRLARFEREARVLASLNHPHIASIYSSESARLGSRTIHFLVMELVEGEDLACRIARGPLAVDDALAITSRIAEALEAAHARGIIHRDLKPANVMVTAAGGLKVLDFGLAKQLMPSVPDESTSATRTFEQLTEQSQIVGTVPYMSPEQLRAGSIDHRSDVFSLGVMLFEMLAGKRPFHGDSRVDLMAAILKEPPADLCALRPDLDSRLINLVLQCMAKDPTARVASARDLQAELTALRQSPVAPPRQTPDARPDSGAAPAPAQLDSRAVAVLPFTIIGGSSDAELMAVGLHNDLITELSRMGGLTVISRASVMGYRDSGRKVPDIGRELNAGTLILGTLQSAGTRVRVTAQLVDATDDTQRWAERFDRQLSAETLFDIQTELSQRIVASLCSQLGAGAVLEAGRLQTEDMDAYRLQTQGRMLLDQRTEDGLRRAVVCCEQALDRDPGYALAWVGLADALALKASYGYVDRSAAIDRAVEAAERALEIDPALGAAHASLGLCHSLRTSGRQAERDFLKAIELQPGYADAHNWLSYYYLLTGRAAEALPRARRAVELNPLSAEAVSNLLLAHLAQGDFERALAEARRTGELSPGWSSAPFFESLVLYELGRFDEVRRLLDGLDVEWTGKGAQATLALAHVGAGEHEAARLVLAEIDAAPDPFAAGLVRLALGEVEAAFERFSAVERLTDWPSLAVHHLYDRVWAPVRSDARFDALMAVAYRSYELSPPRE